MDPSVVSASLLSVTSGIGVFTGLLPELSEVRKTLPDTDVANDVRMGEFAATALVVGIGVTATAMTKNPAPFIISIVSAIVLVSMYESVLHATPVERKA